MPGQHTTLQPEPLTGVTTGTRYFVRNTGNATVYLEVASARPAPDSVSAFPMPRGTDLYPKADSGESIYIWSRASFSRVTYETSD